MLSERVTLKIRFGNVYLGASDYRFVLLIFTFLLFVDSNSFASNK